MNQEQIGLLFILAAGLMLVFKIYTLECRIQKYEYIPSSDYKYDDEEIERLKKSGPEIYRTIEFARDELRKIIDQIKSKK